MRVRYTRLALDDLEVIERFTTEIRDSEPTRGVDIGAKSEIYRIIDELAKKGIGVIVISIELPEIIGTCDRVLVMREGQIEGEVGGPGGKPITQENIMALAAGVAA
jgi:ribose transport system ATP-binding protein